MTGAAVRDREIPADTARVLISRADMARGITAKDLISKGLIAKDKAIRDSRVVTMKIPVNQEDAERRERIKER